MSREYFHTHEEKIQKRLVTLKEMVIDLALEETPCPLLASQLTKLSVLCEWIQADIRTLSMYVAKACED